MKKILTVFLIFPIMYLHSKIELLDRIAIIVDDGVVMESQINKSFDDLKRNYQSQGMEMPPKNIILDQIKEKLIIEELQKFNKSFLKLKIKIRNKIVANKMGYSPITSKPNYSITEDVLFEYIKNNIFNIQNLNEDEIKGLIKKTTIKINIIHPISKFNINCSGKLSDAELY